MRRYLSWIEGLTTNQYVGGSNPSRRTIFKTHRASGFFMPKFNFASLCDPNFTQVLFDSKLLSSFQLCLLKRRLNYIHTLDERSFPDARVNDCS